MKPCTSWVYAVCIWMLLTLNLSSSFWGLFMYLFSKLGLIAEKGLTVEQNRRNLDVMGVCGMHIHNFDLQHVEAIFGSFGALFSNWGGAQTWHCTCSAKWMKIWDSVMYVYVTSYFWPWTHVKVILGSLGIVFWILGHNLNIGLSGVQGTVGWPLSHPNTGYAGGTTQSNLLLLNNNRTLHLGSWPWTFTSHGSGEGYWFQWGLPQLVGALSLHFIVYIQQGWYESDMVCHISPASQFSLLHFIVYTTRMIIQSLRWSVTFWISTCKGLSPLY